MLLMRSLDPEQFVVLTTEFGLGIERGYQACRNPDLVVFSQQELGRSETENNNIYAVPALIAECLSPRDRKGPLAELLDDYRRLRAPEVWIIDPQSRTIEVHRFDSTPGRFTVSREGAITTTELPGITVSLQSLWDAFDGAW
jgi:Uma2 family endonuclease